MNVFEAMRVVLADQRESWTPDEMSDVDCLEHVWRDLLPRDIEGDDDTANAYRVFLVEADDWFADRNAG